METAVSECPSFNTTDKNSLSKAMLHDPNTAERYYVVKDQAEESKAINKRWELLRQHYSSPSSNNNSKVVAIEPTDENELPTSCPSVAQFFPTSALHRPVPNIVTVPPLVSTTSSVCTSPVREIIAPRDLAKIIANQLSIPSKSHVPKTTLGSPQTFVRREGDWYCSECSYDNFTYRTECKHCGAPKLKRKAEYSVDNTPTKKAKHDIVAVLEIGKNKQNEKIYRVKSVWKGETWVREKHVPAEFL